MRSKGKGIALGFGLLTLAACNQSTTKVPESGPLRVQANRESIQRDFVNGTCLRCHGEATARNHFVDLRDIARHTAPRNPGAEDGHHHHEPLIKAGCPKESLFLAVLKSGEMPPRPSDPVPAETLQAIETWIRSLDPQAACSDEPGTGDGQDDEPGA